MTSGAALAALAVIAGTYLVLRPRKGAKARPDTGLTANQDCSTWTVTDGDKTRRLSEEVFARFVAAANLEPWDIADAIIERLAPQCHPHDEGMRSLRELELYKTVFVETINRLFATGRIDNDLYLIYKDEIEGFILEEAAKLKKS